MRFLHEFLAEQGMPTTLEGIRREHIEAWLAELRDKGKSRATISVYFRSLRPFWKWAMEEGFVAESPLTNIARPKVPEQPIPVLTDEQLRALLRTADGTSFEGGRDAATIRLFVDTASAGRKWPGSASATSPSTPSPAEGW